MRRFAPASSFQLVAAIGPCPCGWLGALLLLSWKETASRLGSTWDQVCHAVEYALQWGLAHREFGVLRTTGVDNIQIGKSRKFLTLG